MAAKFINWRIIVLFFVMLRCPQAIAKIFEGELVTTENWAFLTRFCFLSQSGRFEYEFTYPVDYETQSLLFYYDSQSQWPSVYKSSKNCEERKTVLLTGIGQVINLTDVYMDSGCHKRPLYKIANETQYYFCKHQRSISSRRPRWWFMAISNCDSKKGLRLQYKLTMTNDVSDDWLKHFSADEFYILHTDVIFAVFYGGLLIASFVVAYLLSTRRLLHNTYKLYMVSMLSQCIGLMLLSTYYGLYARNGFGCELIKLIGRALQAASTIVFLLLLILLAKGYTVTRARLKKSTSRRIATFMSVYVVIYAALFLFEAKFFDPGEVLYIYESPAGYGLIALRIVGWIWFLYAIIFTLIRYPTKSAFLTRLFLLYSIWFISGPVVILISTFVVPKYMREKIINAVEILIAIEAHLVFFVLTRPSTANKNFPFHVRTTQIDVMAKNGEAGDNTLDNFTHYQYAPTKPSPSLRELSQPNHVFTITANGVNGHELRNSPLVNDLHNSTHLGNRDEHSSVDNSVRHSLPVVDTDSRL